MEIWKLKDVSKRLSRLILDSQAGCRGIVLPLDLPLCRISVPSSCSNITSPFAPSKVSSSVASLIRFFFDLPQLLVKVVLDDNGVSSGSSCGIVAEFGLWERVLSG